jgi:hypothetical protein
MSTDKSFSFDDLEKIVDKISKIKNINQLTIIRDIIINNNPNLLVTENTNGLFMHFDNLTTDTYVQLNTFFKKISKAKISKASNELLSSDSNTSQTVAEHQYTNNSKLKYSNKERNIIKRNLYDKEINGSNTTQKEDFNFINTQESVSNTGLFVKKTKA